ncbi:MAG: NUDIX hydrolase [Lachnospiraceae bacterium]|nr:NUDIX hydrolase [Lachnospiraceae bacterium]
MGKYKEYKSNENDKELDWEMLEVEHVIKDDWIDLRKVKYRFPDGVTFSPYYNYTRSDYVVIVATDEAGNYLTVRQYRHGIRACTNEFPAGKIDVNVDRDLDKRATPLADEELSLHAAKRELLEETGCESEDWEKMIVVPSCATINDNFAYVYRAKNCKRVAKQNLDDSEFLNVRKISESELVEMIKEGEFEQSVHVMAYYMSKQF